MSSSHETLPEMFRLLSLIDRGTAEEAACNQCRTARLSTPEMPRLNLVSAFMDIQNTNFKLNHFFVIHTLVCPMRTSFAPLWQGYCCLCFLKWGCFPHEKHCPPPTQALCPYYGTSLIKLSKQIKTQKGTKKWKKNWSWSIKRWFPDIQIKAQKEKNNNKALLRNM